MKVLLVSQPFDNIEPPFQTSIALINHELALRLRRQSRVEVISPAHFLSRQEERDGVVYHRRRIAVDRARLALRRYRQGGGGLPEFARPEFFGRYFADVAELAERLSPDVVHVQNFVQLVPLLRRRCPRARIVLQMQCEWLDELPREFVGARIEGCDAILGVSRYITDLHRARFPGRADRCATLRNGADTRRFAPAEDVPEGGRRTLLFVGRVSPEKGVHVLLEAFVERVAEAHPDVDLEIVGPVKPAPPGFIVAVSRDPLTRALARFYPGDYGKRLQQLIPPRLWARVRFRGALPHAELPALYRRATALVVPSVWREPAGMPAAEGLASGIPVVATRSGGLAEAVDDGETGLLAERGDAGGLGDALCRVLADRERCRAMGAAGRKRALAHFSWDEISSELLELYRRLVAPCGPGHGR